MYKCACEKVGIGWETKERLVAGKGSFQKITGIQGNSGNCNNLQQVQDLFSSTRTRNLFFREAE